MGGLSQQLLGDQDSRRGKETWSLAHQVRSEKGKPAWEGSRSNCWEIKTPALHQAGKRHGVWPAGKRGRKENPPGRALIATNGSSTLQALHQSGRRDVGRLLYLACPPMRTRGIGWVSLTCGQQVWRPDQEGSHRADKKEGTPAWEGSRSNCWKIKTLGGGKRRGVWPISFVHWTDNTGVSSATEAADMEKAAMLSSASPACSLLQACRKPDLNLVLCGSDAALKASVSKCFRGEKTLSILHKNGSSTECVLEEEKIHGRLISLVELPALNQLSEEEVMRQTRHCVSLCDPGVNVFIIIIPAGPLTDEDKVEIEKIQKIFDSREHFILLFISSLSVEDHVTDFMKSSRACQTLSSCCGGQYRMMGLNEPGNSRQILELLDYIENMKIEPYSLQMHVKAEKNQVRCELDEQNKKELQRMEDENEDLQQKLQSEGE
ncbi:GTPase IMAP family member 8-like protein [Labeo rohita]|uniref:GTPase IMAP family member 8-like protein n=1 Tax=Labeo rohita TaxID=84645 RepID=A0A498NNV1_LABRO|nr:GTPase IMAP family member 8-like protein [Labeo rohita]